MESKLVKLKSDFNNIINIRNTVKNVFDTLQVRIDRLRQIYSEFIKNNKNEMFVFGLDSFHFQSKLIDIEYDDMLRLFLAINNRMYCEYFKLHKIIVEYISKNITDKKVTDLVKINNYPIYKDLEPFKEYKFEMIGDIHENILNMLSILMSVLNNKENELSIHKTKQNIGLNIDNFITTFNFNINVMREKIMMFISYIEFFHKMHSKYLKRFSNKIQLMYTHINNDIKFDDSVEISKNKKKELIDEFVTNNMDKDLIKDLKISIGSETNSEMSDTSKYSPDTPRSSLIDFNLSPIHINTRQKSSSFLNLNFLSGEKKEKNDYKNMFEKNVHRISNMLQLNQSKNDIRKNKKNVSHKLSDIEIEKMFYGIEESCDSIINNEKNYSYSYSLEPDNIGLHIDSFDNQEIKKSNYKEIDFKENNFLNQEDNNIIENKVFSVQEPIQEPIQEPLQEPLQEPIQEQIQESIQEQIQEPIQEQIEESIEEQNQEDIKNDETKTDESNLSIEQPGKKKRSYKKKK